MGDFKLIRGFPGMYDGYHGDGTIGYTEVLDPYRIKDEPIDFEVPHGWRAREIYAKKAEGHVLLFNVMGKLEMIVWTMLLRTTYREGKCIEMYYLRCCWR